MQMSNSTIQLSSFYKNARVFKKVQKQIELLQPDLVLVQPQFIILLIHVPNKTCQYEYSTDHKKIQFILVLGKSYPVHPPRLHLRDAITQPSFNDCRDLIFQVLGEEWHHNISLLKIKQIITDKFLRNLHVGQQIYTWARMGNFHMNYLYPFTALKMLHEKQYFICFKLVNQKLQMLLAIITQTHILIFVTEQQPLYDNKSHKHTIPHQNSISLCRLIFQAQIGCLTEILCCKQNNFTQIVLTFSTKKTYNMQLVEKPIKWKLRCRKGTYLIQRVVKMMKNYQPTQIKLDLQSETLVEEQAALLAEVAKNEKSIYNKFNRATIRQLNLSYQAAVQYYQSKGMPYFQVFVDKIARLNQRPDVRLVMQTAQSPRKIFHKRTCEQLTDSKKNNGQKSNQDQVLANQTQLQSEQLVQIINFSSKPCNASQNSLNNNTWMMISDQGSKQLVISTKQHIKGQQKQNES